MNSRRIRDYLELTKPRLTALALLTTAVGFAMGSIGSFATLRFLLTLLGAALVGGGGNALNQWYERDVDALMHRTSHRPLPSGALQPWQGLRFGLLTAVIGVTVLWCSVGWLAGWLGLATLISYVAIYTPLKRITALCTLIGAIPGAMPPVIGWAAARGRLGLEAWVLFAILFLWQLPHFLAIVWLYREEYERAGFCMLPMTDFGEWRTVRQMVGYSVALLPVSLMPTMIGLSGPVYFFAALTVGIWFLGTAMVAAWSRSRASARRLFLSSVSYLPVVLIAMVLDKHAR